MIQSDMANQHTSAPNDTLGVRNFSDSYGCSAISHACGLYHSAQRVQLSRGTRPAGWLAPSPQAAGRSVEGEPFKINLKLFALKAVQLV